MRVRITKTLSGSIDGIQLTRLSKGQVYDVYTSLACYLLSEELAEPAPNVEPVEVLPVETQEKRENQANQANLFSASEPADSRVISFRRSIAAERSRKKKR